MKYFISFLIPFFFLACKGSSDSDSSSLLQAPDITRNWYRPNIRTTWQWQLNSILNTSYDVDLYDVDLFNTEQATIDDLHAQGKKVICYFSAGSYENWREDKDSFPP